MIPVSIAIFLKDINETSLKMWMQVRREDGPLDGLLEFPGGKIEVDETPVEACVREVKEEVGVDAKNMILFKQHSHTFSDRQVLLNVFFSNFQGLPEDIGQWFEFNFEEKSSTYKGRLPEVNYLLIDQLLDYIKRQIDGNCLELIWQKS